MQLPAPWTKSIAHLVIDAFYYSFYNIEFYCFPSPTTHHFP